ncbi:MAG: cysteine--tRNA ligase [Legionellaceae bacterium]|nr:cysteine--tRNA ligase [Legionellaceae bacterium]MBP9775592.1 cysteine--tRNA ligase [Legionellaceae bacterium]
MTITVYNSLSRQKEPLIPLQPGKIGMYVCGMTVYDRCHLGHARSMVCFDVIVRFLRYSGLNVTYVRNITDIDDKIITRSAERGISFQDLTQEQIALMHADARVLGTLPPDFEPCASQHIPQIIALIQRLYDSGYAYVTQQGDVCFQVEKFKDYGKLSQQDLSKLIAGSRVEIDQDKLSPVDFVLWKKAKPNEPAWASPWGEGRPGWHIECSAMSMAQLGEEFDIHGGGLDLQFPHHENEIAQSEAATEHSYARYWLHVGMLQVNDEKMSKSLGNFFTIADVVQAYHPEIIRYFLLSSHYRSTLNYSPETILNSMKALMRLYQSLRSISIDDTTEIDSDWTQRFCATMQDDFNTPEALAVLFQLSHEMNKTQSQTLAATLKHLGSILGILQNPVETFLQAMVMVPSEGVSKEEIEQFIDARNQARLDKDWQRADEIRHALLEQGIELEDTKSGTIWRRVVG